MMCEESNNLGEVETRPSPGLATVATEAGRLAWSRSNRYRTLALVLLLVGLGCRTALYLFNHPLYMDEAFVAINLVDRDYLGLTEQLDELQVAPLLFLWAERAVYEAIGPSEQALRLVPFLAGITALLLFWHLARHVVSPPAAASAVALLSVSRWPLHMSTQIKPYSLDLLASVALLSLAVFWLRRPERLRCLILLVVVTPVALGASYPAVFVGGGVGVVLLVSAWRRPGWTARLLVVAYGTLLAGSFVVFALIIGQRQFGESGNQLHDYMMDYWDRAFPPAEPVPLGCWLVSVHFGPLLGYPYGNGRLAGAVTLPLVLAGAWGCWRSGRRSLLALCFIPFALMLTAAFLGKYPYGGCTRLSQHLAPAVCLLFGVGVSRMLRVSFSNLAIRWRVLGVIASVLAAFAMGHVTYWSLFPYQDRDDAWSKSVGLDVMRHAQPSEPVIITNLPESVRAEIIWYVRTNGGKPIRDNTLETTDLARNGRIWLLTAPENHDGSRTDAPIQVTVGRGPPLQFERRATYTLTGVEHPQSPLRIVLWENTR